MESNPHSSDSGNPTDRRAFLTVSTLAMGGGLAGGYGLFAVMAGRYLYPAEEGDVDWQYVAVADEIQTGQSVEYTAPNGSKMVIARQSEGNTGDDFVALSSVCPHLGCQVHWEPHNDRFFCPCHNGVFDPAGRPLEGPPAAANQHLVRFPLKVEEGLLYIEAPLTSVVQAERPGDGKLAHCESPSPNLSQGERGTRPSRNFSQGERDTAQEA